METVILEKKKFPDLIRKIDLSKINNPDNKRFFPENSSNNIQEINNILDQFEAVMIDKNDTIYGIFSSGLKVSVFNVPEINKKINQPDLELVNN